MRSWEGDRRIVLGPNLWILPVGWQEFGLGRSSHGLRWWKASQEWWDGAESAVRNVAVPGCCGIGAAELS
ncbi:hypothetical protein E2C01_031771 [Portunus trituberculatus]|uniref:Uncharacterized protein n=1 Tax=Portunus trituberculatus TaxID=210409 RepID=A0A5B7EXU3_PORTR|nr:hypothetical protein [Portunus trituberculatus]